MATAARNWFTVASISFFAREIFAPSTFSAIFRMSLVLLLMGIWKMASGGVFSSASATNLCSASASSSFPVLAKARPRAKCQNTVAVCMAESVRRFQNFVPLVKTHFDGQRHSHETLKRRHVFYVRPHVGREQLRAAPGLRIVAVHGRGHGDEMQIVAVVHHGIDAWGCSGLDVRLIGERCFLVGFQRGFVIAGADVDVRGHVYDVPRSRRKLRQAIRSC